MESIEYLRREIRKWECGASTFLACPEAGARLLNWHLKMADGSIRDIIHWPELESLDDIADVRGGNPILFPFCGRSFDQGVLHYWHYAGDRLPMPMHGFARDSKFEIVEISDRGFSATLIADERARRCYPFDYEFTILYRFHELSIDTEFRLANRGEQAIPWSAGHHFYFKVPWHEDLSRDDYHISLPAAEAFRHLSDGTLQSVGRVSSEARLSDPDLYDRIHVGMKRNPIRVSCEGPGFGIEIWMGSTNPPPQDAAIVTWTESPDAPFYCVEPWMGPPNSPEHKRGLHFVEPGKTGIFTVEVKLV